MDIGVMIFPTDKSIQPIQLAKEVEARGRVPWFPEHSHIPTSRENPGVGKVPTTARAVLAFTRPIRRSGRLRSGNREHPLGQHYSVATRCYCSLKSQAST